MSVAVVCVLCLVGGQRSGAQLTTNSTATPIGRAVMAERNGMYAEAATQYAAVLAAQPTNVSALMGMEHVLPRLQRRAELLAIVLRALQIDSTGVGVLSVAVRTFAVANLVDSASKYADRWSRATNGDDEPYREWSQAALNNRDIPQARIALDAGRAKLGPNALAVERAEMLQRAGDISGATAEWISVVRITPPFRDGAIGLLAQVPPAQRAIVRDALRKDNSVVARQMVAMLEAQWGEIQDAMVTLKSALPPDTTDAISLLRRLYEQAKLRDDHASRLTGGAALEAVAERQAGAVRVHTLMEAAQVYADADDERDARRILSVVAASPDAPAGMTTSASTTLLGVLLAEGKTAEAERILGELSTRIPVDDRDRIARRVAMSWARTGNFDRADALVSRDSSTEGFDLRGRLRLFRGDLAGANDQLKQAGPFDDVREQGIDRVRILALIQAVGVDTMAALGMALLAIERGDSAKAVTQLAAIAQPLPRDGAAEVRLFAGQLALAHRDTVTALTLLHEADVREVAATSAAARLTLAQVAIAQGHAADARTLLESLVMEFPASALVPAARRMLDASRGAVPAGGN